MQQDQAKFITQVEAIRKQRKDRGAHFLPASKLHSTDDCIALNQEDRLLDRNRETSQELVSSAACLEQGPPVG